MKQIRYETRPAEFADAMKSVRAARIIFWLILAAAIGSQVGGFLLIEFGGVLGTDEVALARPEKQPPEAAGKKKPPAVAAKKAPASAPGAKKPAAPAGTAEKWKRTLSWLFPTAEFAGLVAAMLLALTILFAVALSLLGRLGGTGGLVSAFFWSLVLLAIMIPWQQALPESPVACGALYEMDELLAARAEAAEAWDARGLYFVRFLAYPVLAMLVWLVVQLRFARGCAQMDFPHAVPTGAVPPAPAAPPARQPEAAKKDLTSSAARPAPGTRPATPGSAESKS